MLADIAKMIKQDAKERAKGPGDRFIDAMDKYLADVDCMDSFEAEQFYANVLDVLTESWGAIDDTVIPPGFHYRASSAGACKRSQFYARIGAQKDKRSKSALTRRKLDNGTYAHLRLQAYVAHMIWLGRYGVSWPGYDGVVWDEDTGEYWRLFRQYVELETFDPEHNLSGHVDMQVNFRGTVYNIDFKTILHHSKNGAIGFADLLEPHEDYVKQVTSYAIQTGVNDALIVFESKDTQELKAYHVPITVTMRTDYQDTVQDIETKAQRWKAGDSSVLESNSLPFELSKCWRCDYKKVCAADGRPSATKTLGDNAIGG